MEKEEKGYWVAFNVFTGIGAIRFELLLKFFKTAKRAYFASEKELREINLPDKIVTRFLRFRQEFDISSYFLRLEQLGISTLCYKEKNYPKLLKEIADKPPVIYIKINESPKNNFDILNKTAIALVGTRKMTFYGEQVAKIIIKDLVANDLVIVSGLARGVDRVVHEDTIYNRGLTMAVLGNGLDSVYPPEHKNLADQIVQSGGAIISEFPLGAPITPGNFPARNRIISGLSLGVVVIEAAEKSGSLITASCAAEQGREVFAIPGPVTSSLSKGTAELIKKGAKLVYASSDILEELNLN